MLRILKLVDIIKLFFLRKEIHIMGLSESKDKSIDIYLEVDK